jgi:hypothetical protein
MSKLTRLLRRDPRTGRRSDGWACVHCGLTAGPFAADEAALLARLHEQVMSHPAGTTVRLAG